MGNHDSYSDWKTIVASHYLRLRGSSKSNSKRLGFRKTLQLPAEIQLRAFPNAHHNAQIHGPTPPRSPFMELVKKCGLEELTKLDTPHPGSRQMGVIPFQPLVRLYFGDLWIPVYQSRPLVRSGRRHKRRRLSAMLS